MPFKSKHFVTCLCCFILLFFISVFLFASNATARDIVNAKAKSSPVSAILIFGDSTMDPGNNNYVNTPFKSNFWPYGKDFLNRTATGRFTNGKLATDFFAKYLGIKEYVPPYLDPTLSIEELMSGVSFASAGSGFDPLTPTISNVISLPKQLEFLKEYKAKLERTIGKEKTKELINKALFLVSAGTNDFVINYFTLPIRRGNYSISRYMDLILKEARQVFQELWDEGARRIGVVGLPPMGCLPIVITLYTDNILTRNCIQYFSSVARDYNQMLQYDLNAMQLELQGSGTRIAYLDIYEPLQDMMTHVHKYNFDAVNKGCCGTGLVEASFMCNPKSVVCADASKYLFWDSLHPTEKAYNLLFQAVRPVIDALVKN